MHVTETETQRERLKQISRKKCLQELAMSQFTELPKRKHSLNFREWLGPTRCKKFMLQKYAHSCIDKVPDNNNVNCGHKQNYSDPAGRLILSQ